MMIISFAWTTGAFLDGEKTVTRRFWDDSYARKFHKGDIVDAYDKSPRNGGKKVGQIRITKEPYKQKLKYMSIDHFYREGGTRYWTCIQDFVLAMGGYEAEPWVIEFQKMLEQEQLDLL